MSSAEPEASQYTANTSGTSTATDNESDVLQDGIGAVANVDVGLASDAVTLVSDATDEIVSSFHSTPTPSTTPSTGTSVLPGHEREQAFDLGAASAEAAVTETSTEPLDDLNAGGNVLRERIWRLVAANRIGLAYHIALCAEQFVHREPLEPAALFQSAAIAPHIRVSSGELVDHLRLSIEKLQNSMTRWPRQQEHSRVIRIVALGIAMRPTLLAPATGAYSLLNECGAIDDLSESLCAIRKSIAHFGSLNLELTPSVLKGIRDHAIWNQRMEELRERTRKWLERNRVAKIIYAPTTDVWRDWLRHGHPIGNALEAILSVSAR